MKARLLRRVHLLALPLLLAVAASTVSAQQIVVDSLSRNGRLLATNLVPDTTATVEWAPTADGPWTNSWAGLSAVTVDSLGKIRVDVPMFYRVKGIPATNIPTDMVYIPAGTFAMGDTFNEGEGDERPVHTVSVSAFYITRTELTKAQWDEVYQWATNHGYQFDSAAGGKAANHPAILMNWYDAVKWCNARSEKEGRVPAYYTSLGKTNVYRRGVTNVQNDWVRWNGGYRLPTEAEWEKAARGGDVGMRFGFGNTISHGQANYYSRTNETYDVSPTRGYHPFYNDGLSPYTSPVGSFAPNSYGVYDMAGNVWEWCWDLRGRVYSTATTVVDPRGADAGPGRIIRGGSWYYNGAYGSSYCRSSFRGSFTPIDRLPDCGIRPVLAP